MAIQVVKAVYGLAEAAKLWRDKCDETLLKEGFSRCPLDDCLYVNSRIQAIIAVHVDDMNIIGPTDTVIQDVLKKLERHFKITTKSESLLGMAINEVELGTTVSQPYYSRKLMQKYDPQDLLKPKHVPMNGNFKIDLEKKEEKALEILGALSHLSRYGRWDLLFAVNYLGSAPNSEACSTILRYLKYTLDAGFLYKKFQGEVPVLVAFSDAEFNRDDFGRSVGGHRMRLTTEGIYGVQEDKMYEFVLGQGNADFYLKSKRQAVTTDSAPFAEFLQLHSCYKDVIWMRNILEYLGFKQKKTIIFTDSSTSIDIAASQRQMKKRSSHWCPKLFIIKDAEKEGLIHLVKIPTAENPADTLTKPLSEKTFEKHLKNSGFVRSLKEGVEGGCAASPTIVEGTGSNPGSIHRSLVATGEQIFPSVEPRTRNARDDHRDIGVIMVDARSGVMAAKVGAEQRTQTP